MAEALIPAVFGLKLPFGGQIRPKGMMRASLR
jgi:hypothetical protein